MFKQQERIIYGVVALVICVKYEEKNELLVIIIGSKDIFTEHV